MRIEFVPDASLYPFQSRWFDSDRGRIHFIDEGTGPTLLLCHGNPMWSFLYRHIVIALRDRFRCVAVDYLGFGLSDRPDDYGYTIEEHARTVGDLVDHLGLEDFVLMGQDWGGPIGTAVCVERAERVRGVTLGNTWFWPATPSFKTFSAVMSSGVMQRQIVGRNFLVERLMPRAMTRHLTAAEFAHYVRAQPSPAARQGMARMPREIRDAQPLLARLERHVPERLGDKPALIVWGMKDFGFRPKACIPRMRQAFRDIEVVELRGASHYIQEDAPAEIAEAIARRFLTAPLR